MSQPERMVPSKRLSGAWTYIAAFVVAIMIFVTLVIIKPAMPERIILLTGPDGSAYHELGKRIAEELRLRELEVDVVVTDGALENVLHLLIPASAMRCRWKVSLNRSWC